MASTRPGIRTLLALVVAAPLAAGCTMTESALLMGGATLVSFIHTEKTVSDHVIGAATDKDCSTLRMVTEGKPLCRDPVDSRAENLAQAPSLASGQASAQVAGGAGFCYRELGRVSCYDRPNPYSYRANDDNTAQRR